MELVRLKVGNLGTRLQLTSLDETNKQSEREILRQGNSRLQTGLTPAKLNIKSHLNKRNKGLALNH